MNINTNDVDNGFALEDTNYGLQEGSRVVCITKIEMVERPSFENKTIMERQLQFELTDIKTGDTTRLWATTQRTPRAKITKLMNALAGGSCPIDILKDGAKTSAFLTQHIKNKTLLLVSVIKKEDGSGTKIDSFSALPDGYAPPKELASPKPKPAVEDDEIVF